MIGCLIGSACLVGLVALRRGRCGSGGCAPASGRGGGGCGGGGGFGRRTFGRKGGWFGLFASLNLSREQWKAARSAFDELRDEAETLRPEGRKTRDELASLLRGGALADGALVAMFGRHDEVLGKLRPAFARFLAKVHATLEPAQRERLANALELGPLGMAVVGGGCG